MEKGMVDSNLKEKPKPHFSPNPLSRILSYTFRRVHTFSRSSSLRS